jgi:hypothetical protein
MSTVSCERVDEVADQMVQLYPELAVREGRGLQAKVAALINGLDNQFLKAAINAGAEEIAIAEHVEKSLLVQAGYFESFPNESLLESAAGTRPPAACYQCYPHLSGRALGESSLWTCAGTCGRNEKETKAGRLRIFRMREIVLLGSAAWVREARGRWMQAIASFAQSLGLQVELAPASDPFFGTGDARGRKLVQQLKELKMEMRTRVGESTGLAIASFNLHETFFAHRFQLHLLDGTEAYTGCVAFGLERWAMAMISQLGLAQALRIAAEKLA